MKIEDIINLTVIDSSDGSSLGTVTGVIIDQDAMKIVALHVEGRNLPRTLFLPFENVQSAQHDALMIPSAQSLLDRRHFVGDRLTSSLSGRLVLTEDGRNLGTVRSYSFDPQTGSLSSISFAADKAAFGGLWKTAGERHDIPIRYVKTLGEHIVVDKSVPDIIGGGHEEAA